MVTFDRWWLEALRLSRLRSRPSSREASGHWLLRSRHIWLISLPTFQAAATVLACPTCLLLVELTQLIGGALSKKSYPGSPPRRSKTKALFRERCPRHPESAG